MAFVFANLKMNLDSSQMTEYLQEMHRLGAFTSQKLSSVAVPAIYLERVIKFAKHHDLSENLFMAQDLASQEKGAFTSQISFKQAQSLGVTTSLIGHSEARVLGQTSDVIALKVKTLLKEGMRVVYCCGMDPIKEIQDELGSLDSSLLSSLVIAYEPLESIGTGSAMSAENAANKIANLKSALMGMYGEAANDVYFLYGGSVKSSNVGEYMSTKEIDGVLVGGASLVPEDFLNLLSSC